MSTPRSALIAHVDFLTVNSELESLDARLSSIRGVIQTLPQANFDLLKRVTEHLDKYVAWYPSSVIH